ncbi:S8 family serine peptidase [Mesorhizobium caraganae]|uniref:S8 family serine peptidase n=1 Tax=Mesorhizobium caraganae TaxID=483206 RepID=UPI001FEAA6C4|nr:S8 family serine peptidase [Mesorhizobium caraganae]
MFDRIFSSFATTSGTVAAADLRPAVASAIASRQSAISSTMLNTRLAPTVLSPLGSLRALPIKIDASMDPRLQLAIANRRTGKPGLALTSTAGDEIAVIARVGSVDDWEALSDVVPGGTLGHTADKSWIVTGRLPVERIERVRAAPTVFSLKASQPVQPTLKSTVVAMGVGVDALPAGSEPHGGSGVVVGIVDFGCDFAHRNFRRPDGKTRLLAIWHQAGIATPDSPFGYGRVHSTAEIDAALASPDAYAALGYWPSPDNAQQHGTHGTHVMDIAAGNGAGSGQPGVAPEADLIFVEAAISDIVWQGPGTINQAFGDSVQLLEAVRYIFDTAGERPCVVNLSLGTNGGPHDGTSLVEQGLDALMAEKPNRAIVIAASNSQEDGIHTSGNVAGDADHDIVWEQSGHGGGEFELWYAGGRRLEITLIAPDGTVFGPVAPGTNLAIGSPGNVAIFVSSRLDDPNNHDNVIGVWLAAGLSDGNWTLRFKSLDSEAVDYHAWIERDDTAQSSFAVPVPTHTLGSISTGRSTVVVGSYNAHKAAFPLSSFSSSGPTRDGRNKPEVSAPGQDVVAARSRTGTGVVRKSGTSMAAPAVSGLVVLILAEAHRNGAALDIQELRDRLIRGALTNPPVLVAGRWDPRYGYGRASGRSIVDVLV